MLYRFSTTAAQVQSTQGGLEPRSEGSVDEKVRIGTSHLATAHADRCLVGGKDLVSIHVQFVTLG